ncbi:MAG: 4-alpha-glucanotransferase [Candidatus Fimimorpha sp.]
MKVQERFSGILAHPTSFPSRYGIGDFGKGAYDFVDFLVNAGQKLWQVLPLGPTGYGDSPYQAFSAFAGQPLLISPELLIQDNLLAGPDFFKVPNFNPDHVDYGYVIPVKTELLKIAHQHFLLHYNTSLEADYEQFCKEEASWLDDYALFMAGKDAHGGAAWLEWNDDLRDPTPEVKAKWSNQLADSISYYKFIQFLFFRQWKQLREYANSKGIKIIGDIPIFVSMDSADVWANRELFLLDTKGYPLVVAGVPPDYFSATGQLWGNPLYDWDYHKKTNFDWWMKRIQGQLSFVDFLRIDHFRGFEAYFAIPYGETTALNGCWCKGPGADLFSRIQEVFGKHLPIWAEDLGIITEGVEKLRDDFNLPGMKVLQFAFSDLEDNDLLPHHFTTSNCICYTGTHDNPTTVGWYYEDLNPAQRDRLRRYLSTDGNCIHMDMIRTAMSSTANYCIFPIQDALGFGNDCRMNTPSVAAGNWGFRFRPTHLSNELEKQLKEMTLLYGRGEVVEKEEEPVEEIPSFSMELLESLKNKNSQG